MVINYKYQISVEDYNFLRKSVEWNEIEVTQAQTGINNSLYLMCATDGDKAVGMTRVIGDGGYVIAIVDVIVLPEYQGKGIGKNLMQHAMNFIDENTKENQNVWVTLLSAKGKEEFYEKFGFLKRPNEDVGCGMHQWIRK